MKYRRYDIVSVKEWYWYSGKFMIMDGYDYVQRAPFDTINEAKSYIDGLYDGWATYQHVPEKR